MPRGAPGEHEEVVRRGGVHQANEHAICECNARRTRGREHDSHEGRGDRRGDAAGGRRGGGATRVSGRGVLPHATRSREEGVPGRHGAAVCQLALPRKSNV